MLSFLHSIEFDRTEKASPYLIPNVCFFFFFLSIFFVKTVLKKHFFKDQLKQLKSPPIKVKDEAVV